MTALQKQKTLNKLIRQGWLQIFVNDNYDSYMLVEAAVEAGCTCIEYTIRRKDARAMIPWIKKNVSDMSVFVATLVDGSRAEKYLSQNVNSFLSVDEAVDLGVDGLISFLPFCKETYKKYADDLVIIPAVSTPGEAIEQFELGASLVKLANADKSPQKLKTLLTNTHGLLGTLLTGGMTTEIMPSYIEAGALVAAGGFDLFWKELGESATKEQVVEKIKLQLQVFATARRKYQPELAAAIERGEENLTTLLNACLEC